MSFDKIACVSFVIALGLGAAACAVDDGTDPGDEVAATDGSSDDGSIDEAPEPWTVNGASYTTLDWDSLILN